MATRLGRLSLLGSVAMAAGLSASGCGPAVTTPGIVFLTPAPTATSHATPTPTAEPSSTPIATAGATASATASAIAAATPTHTPGPTASPTAVPHVATIKSTTINDHGNSPNCGAWHVNFKMPVVMDVSGATAINAGVTATVNGYINDFKALLSHGGTPGAGDCSLDGAFTVGINSQTLLDFSFTMDEYLGGASDAALAGSLNFGVADGAPIHLVDLFTSEAAGASALSSQSRTLLTTLLASDADASSINAGTAPVMSNFDKAWVFRTAGLQITFQQNQVASAVDGTPTITIPWASIKAVLKTSGPAGQFSH